VLRKWVKEFGSDPTHAFPGHGQMKPEQLEIERAKREVNKLKAERDILKRLRPSSRRKRHEVRLRREAPDYLAGGMAMQVVREERGRELIKRCVEPGQFRRRPG
jgi:hypothetical protein